MIFHIVISECKDGEILLAPQSHNVGKLSSLIH